MRIAFLGTGAMGIRMIRRLLSGGHELIVWNRTGANLAPLLNSGAEFAPTPAAAVRDAQVVFSMVRDDTASEHLWCEPTHGALSAMMPGAMAIECSTLSVEWVRTLGNHMRAANIDFIEAPVSGSRASAELGELIFLVAGTQTLIDKASPLLLQLGKKVNFTGEIGNAAMAKLFTNALLGTQVALFAELIGALKLEGESATKVIQAMATTSSWSPIANYLTSSMLSEDFEPQFPVELMSKDLRYLADFAQSKLPVVEAVTRVFCEGSANGFGHENMTAVAKLY